MARKFGKKNKVSLNPLDANICLLGLPKIGKTTICKEMAEKFIEEHEVLLHKISWSIYEKCKAYSVTADEEDVFVDCVIAVYDVFRTFTEHGVSV